MIEKLGDLNERSSAASLARFGDLLAWKGYVHREGRGPVERNAEEASRRRAPGQLLPFGEGVSPTPEGMLNGSGPGIVGGRHLIQQEANPGINATIRDRFYGAASSTPVTVFGNLMRLSNHHLSKLEKEKHGLFVVRKQLIGEIMSLISDFPAHLGLADQGRFAIGYYHQTQDLWTKKAVNQ